ncbi:MAG: tRNA uracil 4-sulfurtransferase ThiI [Spirochaetia bacterium]
MDKIILIKYGELQLKGGNRRLFEKRLNKNIQYVLQEIPHRLSKKPGRLYIESEEIHYSKITEHLRTMFGIVGFSVAYRTEKNEQAIKKGVIQTVSNALSNSEHKSFKVEARRTDKSFPLTSYKIAAKYGSIIKENFPELDVDVKNPELTIFIEIRGNAYVYSSPEPAGGGLPVGTSGKSVLLLSGGIDSPVAGYLMAKRGLQLSAVYFHAYPYTSEEAKQKVLSLARIVSRYALGLKVYVIPFTKVQMYLKKKIQAEALTLMLRACMMRAAHITAETEGAKSLITGESLGQVASQTQESLRFTQSITDFPVFRPCIGMDKEEIIRLARKIGSFETSILPYEDCCTIFTPPKPLVKPLFEKITRTYNTLSVDELIIEAIESAEIIKC